MEFLDPKLDAYVHQMTKEEPLVLQELNRETNAKVVLPRMLAGHLQGRVLSMLSHMIRPKFVLDVGTYTGYSAHCFAEGLQEGGKVVSLDVNDELAWIHEKYVKASEFGERIDIRFGKALEVIPDLDFDWDIVFLDADKENYINYYNLVIDKLKPGAYILADNVLWSGKILDEPSTMDQETKTLYEYSKMVKEDPRVENVLFPIRDGLMVARKK
jgi:caffeoyl-CoA O-methyltransferase